MKNKWIIILSVLFMTTGCKKGLDVSSSTQVTASDLFKQKDGFRIALLGIYQSVAGQEIYGATMTWRAASALAGEYNNNTVNNAEYNFYNGTVAASTILMAKDLWSKAYNAIVNCNKLLAEIEKKDSSFFEKGAIEKNMIKGEAIAMRALLHLDILRFFSSAPALQPNDAFIPYHNSYPSKIAVPQSNKKIIELITADLMEARILLKPFDTNFSLSKINDFGNRLYGNGFLPAWGLFFSARIVRLNYMAITGILARAHMYNGDYPNAKTYAAELYDTYSPDANPSCFAWTSIAQSTSASGRYFKLGHDIMFAAYDDNLQNKINLIITPNIRYAVNNNARIWFPEIERDARRNLIDFSGSEIKIHKWKTDLSIGNDETANQLKIAPVIRMSEAYLIYSECLFREGKTVEALNVLNKLKQGRGSTSTFTDDTESGYFTELFNEFRREFFLEGQTIFQYKRLGRSFINQAGTPVDPGPRFTFAIPDGEVIN